MNLLILMSKINAFVIMKIYDPTLISFSSSLTDLNEVEYVQDFAYYVPNFSKSMINVWL